MKRLLCLLALTLLGGSLAACGGGSANPATPPPVSSPTAASQPTPSPLASPTAAAKAGDMTALGKAFIDLLVKGDYASAAQTFDETMKAAMPPDKLRQTWEAILAQVGPFKRQVAVRSEKTTQGGEQYEAVIVTAEFEKMTLDLRVVYDSRQRVAGFFAAPSQSTAPTPSTSAARPSSLTEKDVTVGSGEWALPGTLTLPAGSGPFPAVVLVHGSGPNDRDETLGPNKPFRDLAWGLASRGFAVLRYDKRTYVYGQKFAALPGGTVKEEVVDDALAAVALLRQTEGIRSDRIFVLGHSLGATLVPRIGQQDPKIAGFVVMAGITRPLPDVALEQLDYIASLGNLSPAEKAQIDEMKRQLARVKDPNLSKDVPASELFGAPAGYWLDLRGYSPADVAKTLAQPMLILQGERDYQVTTVDFEGWKKALAGRANVQFKLYPKLNHLFLEGEGKSTPAEYSTAGQIPSYVLDDIATWLKSSS